MLCFSIYFDVNNSEIVKIVIVIVMIIIIIQWLRTFQNLM